MLKLLYGPPISPGFLLKTLIVSTEMVLSSKSLHRSTTVALRNLICMPHRITTVFLVPMHYKKLCGLEAAHSNHGWKQSH